MADRHSEELRTFAHLAGLLEGEFPREILERRVRLVVGEGVLASEAGQVLTLTVARLLPRFCHRVDVVAPDADCLERLVPLLAAPRFSAEALAALAHLIWSDGEFTVNTRDAVDVVIGIGAPGDVSVGIDRDGAACVVRRGSATVARGEAVFAALTAAGVACALSVKLLYPEIVGETDLGQVRLDQAPLGGPLDPAPRRALDRPFVAGVGAIGCAVVYALIAVGASGSILLLDPDVVNDSNLMRYILFDSRHLGLLKVEAAKNLVAASGLRLDVEIAKSVLQEYLKEDASERDRMHFLVSAVDTYDARREIAGELPREIVNAGTSSSDFTISRHRFADGFSCLACLYPAAAVDVDASAVMARELGLEKDAVAQLRRTKAPLTPEMLERVAETRSEPATTYAAYIGEPIDSFYNKVVCGTAAINTARGEAVAPLAYGSALAGFLLAQTVLASPETEIARRLRWDFVRGLGTPQRTSPRPRPACPYCGRGAFVRAYEKRWGSRR